MKKISLAESSSFVPRMKGPRFIISFGGKRPQMIRDDLKRQTTPNDVCTICRDSIKSYEEACIDDPELQSVDSELLQLVKRAIDSLLDTSPNDRPLSLGFLTVITDCLVQISRQPAKFIVESRENVSNDEAFSLLVSLYMEITNKMLEFGNALETEVARAKISRMTIRRASRAFDMEVGDRSKRGRAKEELKKFKIAGEPFKDVFKLLEIVHDQQAELLEKLHEQKRRFNKKSCKRVSNVMFATACVSLLILSVATAAAAAAPTVAQEVAGALSAAEGHAGRWCREAWEKYEEVVEGKRRVAKLREIGDIAMVKGFENIDDIIKILETTPAAGEDEAAEVRRRMKALTEEFDGFVERADELGQKAAKYLWQIVAARSTVMEQKLNFASVS